MEVILQLKQELTTNLKEITSIQTLILKDRITEANLIRKDINIRDMRIATIAMLIQDHQIEQMEMTREDSATMKTEMKAMFKITMEDKEHKEVKVRLPINLEIRVKILKAIKSDLEEIRAIMTAMNNKELLSSTARLRH